MSLPMMKYPASYQSYQSQTLEAVKMSLLRRSTSSLVQNRNTTPTKTHLCRTVQAIVRSTIRTRISTSAGIRSPSGRRLHVQVEPLTLSRKTSRENMLATSVKAKSTRSRTKHPLSSRSLTMGRWRRSWPALIC